MRSPDYLHALDLLHQQQDAFAEREQLRQASRTAILPDLAAAIEVSAEGRITEARRLLTEAIAALCDARSDEDSQRLYVAAYDERRA